MTTLVIEDNLRLRTSLERGLRECGLDVHAVATGRAALDLLDQHRFDAIVLDLGLPDVDGLEMLVAAREAGVTAHVLVLSARDAVEQRVQALDRGADDYMVKPFVFAELVARLRALARRTASLQPRPAALAGLQLETDRPSLTVGARRIQLSPREHALLRHMLSHAGRVISRRELLSAVFGCEFDPGTNVVEVHIAHLRRKLEGLDVHVETVRGRGYCLRGAAECERLDA